MMRFKSFVGPLHHVYRGTSTEYIGRTTLVFIFNENRNIIYSGKSIQSEKDKDNRITGQKQAVKNMCDGIEDRVTRAGIWEEFFNKSQATRKLKKTVNTRD